MENVNFFLWGNNSEDYFNNAEEVTLKDWETIIKPFTGDCLQGNIVDLACGRGRWTKILSKNNPFVYSIDVNPDNIEFCKKRFSGENVSVLSTDGYTLTFPDNSIDSIFCFDAMVHFDIDVIISYLKEIKRVLKPDGKAFLHHSNLANPENIEIRNNPHWRNYMNKDLFAFLAKKAGLEVVKQQVIDWGGYKNLDCLTLLQS